jgi:CRISPR-associated endonuclease/helicase Cas3
MTSQRAIVSARAASGLPRGWRHEQLSAAIAYGRAADLDDDRRDLTTRLVATTHGRGRRDFPHVGSQLVPGGQYFEIAKDLFDDGAWEQLAERTEAAWGVWGCAYLEAILRAADAVVSRRKP